MLRARAQRMKNTQKLQLKFTSLLLQQQTMKQNIVKRKHMQKEEEKRKKNNLPCLNELFPLFINENVKP